MTTEIGTLSRMSTMEIVMKDFEKAFSRSLAAAQRFRSCTGNGEKHSGRKIDEFFQFLSQHERAAKKMLRENGFISGESIYRFDSEKIKFAVGASSAGVILAQSACGNSCFGCQYVNGDAIEPHFLWTCLPYPRGVLYLTDEELHIQMDGLDTVIMSKENGNPLFDVSADISVDHFGGIFYEVFIEGSGKGSGMVMKRYYHPTRAEWISLSVPPVWEEHRNKPTLEWAGMHPSGKIISHWILTVGSNKWDTIFLGDEKLFDLSNAGSYEYEASRLGVVIRVDGKVYIDDREICAVGKEAELYVCCDGFILHEDGQFIFRTATDEQLLYTGEVTEAFVEIAGNDLFVVVPRDGENGIRPEVRRIPVKI
jgi:hypothetical protein